MSPTEGPIPDAPLAAHGLDRVVPLADGSYLLFAPRSKAWQARRGSTRTSAEHPGSAIRWREGLFEVAAADPQPDGGIRYRLEPWQDRHAIRVIENYDEATELGRQKERTDRAQSLGKRQLAILLSPVLGHLPGDVQHRMETEFSAPAQWMTVASAVPVFVFGFLGLINSLVTMVGESDLFPWAPPTAIALYLTVESVVRVGSAWIAGHPMGSVLGVLLYRTIEAVVRPRRPSGAAVRPPAPRPAEESAKDRFRLLEPLLSLLPESDQRILERRFGFESLRWGRMSVTVLLAVGGLNVGASLLALAGGLAGLVDAAWLAGGGALCVEQLVRRAAIARGGPRGSILGAVVRPFAAILLVADPALPGGPDRPNGSDQPDGPGRR